MKNKKYDIVKEQKKLNFVRVIAIIVGGICWIMTLLLLAAIFIPYNETSELDKVKTELRETKRELIRQRVKTELAETKGKEGLITDEELIAFGKYMNMIGMEVAHVMLLWSTESGSTESSRYCREESIPELQAERTKFTKVNSSQALIRVEDELLQRNQEHFEGFGINCNLREINL